MHANALETLFSYLATRPDFCSGAAKILFLRAEWHPALQQIEPTRLTLHQTFRPQARVIEQHGHAPTAELTGGYQLALIVPTKQKKESLALIARAFSLLDEGGTCIISCENHRGARSYRDALKKLCGEVETWSKNHCVIAWASKNLATINQQLLSELQESGRPRTIEGTEHHSQPGVFSWDAIDEGSALLATYLPSGLSGAGADFGAGTGYLSVQLLQRNPEIKHLALYEAEQIALDCARQNLSRAVSRMPEISYHWVDLEHEAPSRTYDWIVMNPPCHDAREIDLPLGQTFLQRAFEALNSSGTLYMVGNSHLPYEKALRRLFSSVITHRDNPRFTVYIANRS